MRLIKLLVAAALAAFVVLTFGMIGLGWEVGGHTWPELREKFLPTKKALETRRDAYIKEAEKAGDR